MLFTLRLFIHTKINYLYSFNCLLKQIYNLVIIKLIVFCFIKKNVNLMIIA